MSKVKAYFCEEWTKDKLDTMAIKLGLKNKFNDDFFNAMSQRKAHYIVEDKSNNLYGHSWSIEKFAQHEVILYDDFKIDYVDSKKKKILIQSFSSGIDSTTTIYQAMEDSFDMIIPVNYTYGQKNIVETVNQKQLIKTIQKKFPKLMDVLSINIESMFPDGMNLYQNLRDSDIIKEKTGTEYYTPMRNMLFSTIAAMVGELAALNENEEYQVYVGIGVHRHSDIYAKDYWDITPEFVKRLNYLFALNDNIELKLYAPFQYCTKTELIEKAIKYNVPYKDTWTCYNPSIKDGVAIPCLECEACLERELAFKNCGVDDGNNYQVQLEDDNYWEAVDSDINQKG